MINKLWMHVKDCSTSEIIINISLLIMNSFINLKEPFFNKRLEKLKFIIIPSNY